MTEPTIAELIERMPAAERAIVEALVRRLAVLVTPAPRRRRPPPISIEDIPPERRARIRADLARAGFSPSR